MRSIPLFFLLFIITIQLLLSSFCFLFIKKIQKHKQIKKLYQIIYWTYSFSISLVFLLLFITPGSASSATGYEKYFIFNIVLIADIFSKLLLSTTLVIYYIFSIFNIKILSILWMGFILASGLIITILAGSLIGTKEIRIEKVVISHPGIPDSFNGFKIVQISDIHLGSYNGNQKHLEKAFQKINNLHPGLILFTGDLVNNFSYETTGWDSIFFKLKATSGIYSILGNHDYGDYYQWSNDSLKTQNFLETQEAYQRFGFQVLNNESVPVIFDNDTIFLMGVENWGHIPFPQYADLDKALKDIPGNSFKILMTHDPSHWENSIKEKEDIQLTLSGHTHGMQWGWKFAGIEFSIASFLQKYWGGLYQEGANYLYINRGLGTIGINLRIDMPPEITCITLKKR